jgi:hypothetical protein
MPALYLVKSSAAALVPLDQPTIDYIDRCPEGAGLLASVKQYNCPAFHRKMFALLQHAYDVWEPRDVRYRGEPVRKNFEAFRRDLTIMAGFGDVYVDLDGRLRLVAQSLDFSRMNQTQREALFSALVDVVLTRILTNYTRADLDNVLAQTLAFTR